MHTCVVISFPSVWILLATLSIEKRDYRLSCLYWWLVSPSRKWIRTKIESLTDITGTLWRSQSVAILLAMCLMNSQKSDTISSSAFFEAVLGRWEATVFKLFHGQPTGRFFKRSCGGLDLHENSIIKVEGSKTGIYYNASFLPSHSLIFSLPTLSKSGINDETGTTCKFNFTEEYLDRSFIKPTQIINFFLNWRDGFLEELWYTI